MTLLTVLERNEKVKTLFNECLVVLESKGNDYTKKSANDNFDIVGEFVGISKYGVWATYFYKHLSAIMSFIKNGKLESEPIKGRILDAINYLGILYTMIDEDKNAK